MDFHKKLRSQITRAAAFAMNLDAMAQNDEYVNSDPSNNIRSRKEDPVQSPIARRSDQVTDQRIPLERIHNGETDDDDDDDEDLESDPIMSMISKQKTSLHASVTASETSNNSLTTTQSQREKDPNRFLKKIEALNAPPPVSYISTPSTNSSNIDIDYSQPPSPIPGGGEGGGMMTGIGITEKMEWMKSNILNPSHFKNQFLSKLQFYPLKSSLYNNTQENKEDEEEEDEEKTKSLKHTTRKGGEEEGQPIVLSTSILRPEETMELIRLQAAARGSTHNYSSHLLLFFYFLQDKLVQHRCMAIIGILILFLYVIKGFSRNVYT